MAHLLNESANEGRGSMFYVGDTPWHQLGVSLTEAPSLSEAIKLACANYEVVTEPLYTCQNGIYTKVEVGNAIIRSDTREVFAVTGNRYAPLQNWDAFGVLEPLLDRGVAMLETGGTLREGADAWMLARFNIDNPVVQEVFASEVIPYCLISNNHSTKFAARIMETPIRVVCANTLGAATSVKGGVSIKHTHTGSTRMVEAAEAMFAKITEHYISIAQDYKLMKETIFTAEQFATSVLDILSPMPNDEAKGFVKERAIDKRITVAALWERGKGHTGDHSAWEAYNGAVECLDHDDDTFKVRGSRIEAIKDGKLANMKADVLDSVLAVCRK